MEPLFVLTQDGDLVNVANADCVGLVDVEEGTEVAAIFGERRVTIARFLPVEDLTVIRDDIRNALRARTLTWSVDAVELLIRAKEATAARIAEAEAAIRKSGDPEKVPAP